jgi:pseudaminic acid cytidylyltransferase
MIVAVIPARGGSKRIPRKNIRPFAGKPIIAYSIAAAQECALFDRILVSTEDAEIASVARDYGADVPFVRPPELSDDRTGTGRVTAHALGWLADCGQAAEIACCIYATAPFIRPNDLRRGYDALVGSSKSFAFSVTLFDSAVQRAIRITDGGVAPFFPQWVDHNTQDLEAAYRDAGQFYWGRAEAFRAGLPVFADHSIPIVLPRHRVLDIDTPEHWHQAELMYAALAAAGDFGKPL